MGGNTKYSSDRRLFKLINHAIAAGGLLQMAFGVAFAGFAVVLIVLNEGLLLLRLAMLLMFVAIGAVLTISGAMNWLGGRGYRKETMARLRRAESIGVAIAIGMLLLFLGVTALNLG